VGRKGTTLAGGLNYEGGKSRPLHESEATVQARIKEYLDTRGIYYQRTNSGMVQKGKHWIKLCDEGTPDLIICYRGFLLGCETKTVVGKVTPEQAYQHVLIERSGGFVLVPRSLDAFIEGLCEIDEKINRFWKVLIAVAGAGRARRGRRRTEVTSVSRCW
jgi:hypothetical protein